MVAPQTDPSFRKEEGTQDRAGAKICHRPHQNTVAYPGLQTFASDFSKPAADTLRRLRPRARAARQVPTPSNLKQQLKNERRQRTQRVSRKYEIRVYEIYLRREEQPGSELEDWLQAERALTS